jgi:hypothetical protein
MEAPAGPQARNDATTVAQKQCLIFISDCVLWKNQRFIAHFRVSFFIGYFGIVFTVTPEVSKSAMTGPDVNTREHRARFIPRA